MPIKNVLYVLGGIIVAIAISIASAIFLWGVYFNHWDTPFTRAVSSIIPVPVARVGNAYITLDRYYRDVDGLRKYYESDEAKSAGLTVSDFGVLQQMQVLERLIEEEAIFELASKNKVTLTNDELDKAIDDQFVSPSSTRQDLETNLMKTYGWDMDQFKEHIVRPILLERKMASIDNPEDPRTGMANVMTQLSERIKQPDVVRYIKFE